MTTHHDPQQQRGDADQPSQAVQHAEVGAQAWRAVVHAQQSATADHADFYALAGHLVDTLSVIQSFAEVLGRQVDGYAGGLDAGRVVYDDTRLVDPHERLMGASVELAGITEALGPAVSSAHRFWSAIGHIGVEVTP